MLPVTRRNGGVAVVSGERRRWTRTELILAFNLYTRTPFGKLDQRNPDVVDLASRIGRTPGAVALKLSNFASLDPSLKSRGIRGMANVSADDRAIWEEFAADGESLAFESEKARAVLEGHALETTMDPSDLSEVTGRDRDAIVRVRVNQGFFRRMILARYDVACCITGLRVPELLSASHILPWAGFPEHRLNPANGICLNALHDRAFDRGLITFTEDLRVQVSPIALSDPSAGELLGRFDGAPLRLRSESNPDPSFLRYHRESIFRT